MLRWFVFAGSLVFLVFGFSIACNLPTSDTIPTQIPTVPVTPQQPVESIKTPTATLEKGWRIYSDKDEGFEIALPSMWQALTKEQIAQSEEKAGLSLSGGGRYIFYGLDIFATSLAVVEGKSKVLPFGGSLSILKTNLTVKISLDGIEAQNVLNLGNDPNVAQPIFHKQVEVLTGQALKIKYTMKLPNRTEPVVFINYYLIRDNNLYCFTFETLPALIEKLEQNYDKMAYSFQFIR
jgi:hypothetical protein